MFDIHYSQWPFEPPAVAPDCDVIILAGDAGEELSRRVLPWIADTFLRYGLPVVYVLGNHDFYRCNLSYEVSKAQLVAEHYGITLLAPAQTIVLGGTLIVGSTLWTDYNLGKYGHVADLDAMRSMNDFRFIRTGSDYRKALPKDVIDEHYAQRTQIEKVLAEPVDGPTVVVTHHAPLEASLQTGRQEGPLDAAYASDLSELIERHAPELWLRGHSHTSHDYMHAGTHVLSDPRGYLLGSMMHGRGRRYPENPAFDPFMVIEVTRRPRPNLSAD